MTIHLNVQSHFRVAIQDYVLVSVGQLGVLVSVGQLGVLVSVGQLGVLVSVG